MEEKKEIFKKRKDFRNTDGFAHERESENLWLSLGKALQGEIKNVTDPRTAAALTAMSV